MSEGFSVGDFRSPETLQRPRQEPAAAPAAEPSATEAPKTPSELYQERLKEVGISKEHAAKVFDDVITTGYYQETILIRGRKAILRTRSYEDHMRSLEAMESQGPRFQLSQEELQSRHNLAASLVEWNGVVYKKGGDPDVEFRQTMQAVQKLPAPVYGMLIAALVKFDAQMFVVFSDGAAESF